MPGCNGAPSVSSAQAQKAAHDAGMHYGLYLDLAVGTHPAGAETWAEPAQFARGVSLGAPPDAFSAEGQVWGVAPLSPRALVDSGFAVLAETLREQFRFCGLCASTTSSVSSAPSGARTGCPASM
jgi:4-alpha-glucanotransferase